MPYLKTHLSVVSIATFALLESACVGGSPSPTAPIMQVPAGTAASVGAAHSTENGPWGPEQPPFNLEAQLRGEGFGLVKFRQPNDGQAIVYLDAWVRDLKPDTEYQLQRAVDVVIDGVCASESWLTLGAGPSPQSILTDGRGTGAASLWRGVPPTPGARFDIHFRIVEAVSGHEALRSECYQYVVSL